MKTYDTYNIEDFAADEEFCRWVLYPDGKERQLFEEFLASHPEKAQIVAEAKQLVLALRFAEKPIEENQVNRLWERIELSTAEPAKVVPFWNRGRILLAVAAAIALLVLVWVRTLAPKEEFILTEKGTAPYELTLPDGSVVILNAESQLSFSKRDWNKGITRTVKLRGEGRFEVKKGKLPFVVESPHGKVQVLGTSFNVYDRTGNWEVKCFTGKVRVAKEEVGSKDLTPSLAMIFEDTEQVMEVDSFYYASQQYKDWVQGYFYYDNEAFEQVAEEFMRQFDVQLNYPEELKNKPFSGPFDRGESLEKALDQILFPYLSDYQAKIEGKNISIVAK